ncbi:uncharacterized protein LOC129718406 isoform X2 [Wyeomyia smithii]|uniref:uncharacterized protein LOC129718406 isoform X2 n=1 Tax=Wyeomyia smithii TaxID=174621 RepID=UPI002467DD01|nr:uncharacterized protein LOC129718406 isoform X2 [Wyeomyia smithii]
MSTSSVIVEPLDTTVKEISPRETTNAIRSWACDFNITHRALKEILSIIRHDYGDKDLPMDPRTLIRTPQRTGMTFKSISGGQYWHQGLEICLKKSFEHLTEDIQIELNVNIDGLPIHRSSKYQFWPILCNVHQMPHIPPMTVGIFLGKIKPQNITEYLTPFVEELISVLSKGVKVNNHAVGVKIRCIVCDSPARAFIKGTTNFNGINGCLKCTIEGEYSYVSRTVTFPKLNCVLRTDEKFRRKEYGRHHKEDSPLLKIPGLDMIKDFVDGEMELLVLKLKCVPVI